MMRITTDHCRLFFSVFIIVLIFSFSSRSQANWDYVTGVEVSPQYPSSTQSIDITLYGQKPTPCTPLSHTVERFGWNLYFDIVSSDYKGGCITVIADWSFTETVENLPMGRYYVYARSKHEGEPDGSYRLLGKFDVSDYITANDSNCIEKVLEDIESISWINEYAGRMVRLTPAHPTPSDDVTFSLYYWGGDDVEADTYDITRDGYTIYLDIYRSNSLTPKHFSESIGSSFEPGRYTILRRYITDKTEKPYEVIREFRVHLPVDFDTLQFTIEPEASWILQTGGFAGVYKTYPADGMQLELAYNREFDIAMLRYVEYPDLVETIYVDCDYYLPQQIFQLSQLEGHFVDDSTLEFIYDSYIEGFGPYADIRLTVVLEQERISLNGLICDPYHDGFCYHWYADDSTEDVGDPTEGDDEPKETDYPPDTTPDRQLDIVKIRLLPKRSSTMGAFQVKGRFDADIMEYEGVERIYIKFGSYVEFIEKSEEAENNRMGLEMGTVNSLGRYLYTGSRGGITKCVLDFKKGRFDIRAKDVDLGTFNSNEISMEIAFNNYYAQGSKVVSNNAIHPFLTSGSDLLLIDTFRIKDRGDGANDKLIVNGRLFFPDPIDWTNEPVTIQCNHRQFTIPPGSLQQVKKSVYRCKNAPLTDGGFAQASLDTQRNTFEFVLNKIALESSQQESDLCIIIGPHIYYRR